MSQTELSDKPFAIPKQAVVEAFRKVKANQGGPGVDGCTIEEYESDLRNRLYVTWNRMSSGSYFPPPVKVLTDTLNEEDRDGLGEWDAVMVRSPGRSIVGMVALWWSSCRGDRWRVRASG